GIWSGKAAEPKDAGVIYAQLNRYLIKCFTDVLRRLECGKQFTPGDIADIVSEAEQKIINIFPLNS
ncbi:MAG: B12-binding domain-containing radical SAM protein, partial [Peptococcaceae bacterium]|nr:B12-binding domain-containing radical SAM protein [Peptococcaceae bacterium]